MRIRELSLNPAKAFSSGFDKASDTVDTAFSPSKWGQSSATAASSSAKTKSSSATKPSITLEKHQIRDAAIIMQAVINGDVSTLSQQQTELAKRMLTKIQQL